VHTFDFSIGIDFLSFFENAPEDKVSAKVSLHLEKRAGLITLDFKLTGNLYAPCDRCLAEISIPLESDYRLLIKSMEHPENVDCEDVIVLHPETPVWNAANIIYESILLAIPAVKKYDCESEVNPPCDQDMVQIISRGMIHERPGDEGNSPWNILQEWGRKKKS
jgi:uncharacterized metal-binding protein YceD (DUF177 family)